MRDVREVQQLVGEGEELGEEREKSVRGGRRSWSSWRVRGR